MDFDLNAPVDSIDKVPEQFRSLFVQGADGKFAPDEKSKGIREAIVGLNTSLKAARTDADNAKKGKVDLSILAEFGTDPTSIKAAFDARVADLTAKGSDATKAVERVRSEMTTANKAALDASNAKTAAYQGQLYTLLVKNDALSAIAEAKGLPDLLMPFIEKNVKVLEEDGKFVVHVLDDKGERRYSGVTGQPMTIKELVAGMKADAKFGRLFESDNQRGGGGANQNDQNRKPANQGGTLSPNQKIAGALGKGKYQVPSQR